MPSSTTVPVTHRPVPPSRAERAASLSALVTVALLENPKPPTKLGCVSVRQVARRYWWAFGGLAAGAVCLPSLAARWLCVGAAVGLVLIFLARAVRLYRIYASQLVAHQLLGIAAQQPDQAQLHLGIYVYRVKKNGVQLMRPTPLVYQARLPASWVEAMLQLVEWSANGK